MTSFLTRARKAIQNTFHRVVNRVEWMGVTAGEAAVKAGVAAIEYVEKNGGEVLRNAASAAVLAAATKQGSGREKFDAAFTAVATALTALGLPVIQSAVNLAIEMALADLKKAGIINA